MTLGRVVAAAVVLMAALPLDAVSGQISTISISTILASNNSRNWDDRLDSVRKELRPLRFKSYRLVGAETRNITSGDQCGTDLPGGRYLHVTTKEVGPEDVRLHILLNEGNRPVINTDVKLTPDTVIVLGGPHDRAGTLIITISAETDSGSDDDDNDKVKAVAATQPSGSHGQE